MKKIQNIKVFLQFDEDEILVGELAQNLAAIYFKYDPEFLKRGLELSPYKLPLSTEIKKGPDMPFQGLHGVFDDSLPDGWGRLLLDRKLINMGIVPQEVGPIERLSFIGSSGPGALVYQPEYAQPNTKIYPLDLDNLEANTKLVFEGISNEIIDELYNLGGSSGGARPKINVAYSPATQQITNETQHLQEGFEHWIVKFPSSLDLPDSANIEFAYYQMAIDAGIEMSASKLLKGISGKDYFATKRFDRIGNKRIHMLSASGLLNDDFRRSGLDYGHLMDAAFHLEKDVQAYSKVLRLAAFNLFTHNRDDHSKNFSFLMDENGKWKFAPAYDLTFSSSSHGMHSTTFAGAGVNPNADHLRKLGKEFGVKNTDSIINDVQSIISNWTDYARAAGVSTVSTKLIEGKLSNLR